MRLITGPRRRRSHRDGGAAAVEFALVLPLLLLIVFGIIDFGRLLNAQIKTTEAAREGARAASIVGGTTANRKAQAEVRIAKVDADISIDSGDYCSSEDAAITTKYTFSWVTPVGDLAGLLGGGSWGSTITVKGKGVMPCRA
ncbi:MAG: pilus assembly protein [Hamadaea sp.]|nr:pilus assembly protein [Hamadaea sp.]